jgi:hypothetical protein
MDREKEAGMYRDGKPDQCNQPGLVAATGDIALFANQRGDRLHGNHVQDRTCIAAYRRATWRIIEAFKSQCGHDVPSRIACCINCLLPYLAESMPIVFPGFISAVSPLWKSEINEKWPKDKLSAFAKNCCEINSHLPCPCSVLRRK